MDNHGMYRTPEEMGRCMGENVDAAAPWRGAEEPDAVVVGANKAGQSYLTQGVEPAGSDCVSPSPESGTKPAQRNSMGPSLFIILGLAVVLTIICMVIFWV